MDLMMVAKIRHCAEFTIQCSDPDWGYGMANHEVAIEVIAWCERQMNEAVQVAEDEFRSSIESYVEGSEYDNLSSENEAMIGEALADKTAWELAMSRYDRFMDHDAMDTRG